MNKTEKLFEDVIFPHHPEFRRSLSMRRFAIRSPGMFKIEHLVEQTMAIVGGYEFIDGDHCDFTDGTDCKTASIWPRARYENSQSHPGEISGLVTAGGGEKLSALRCVVYCAPQNRLDYYFIPKSYWEDRVTIHPSSGVGKLKFSYHRGDDCVHSLEPFRVSSFQELATSPRRRFAHWRRAA